MTATTWPHLELRKDGRLWIEGTQIKVLEVILDHVVNGLDAETIVSEYPHLTPAQVHSALSFYYDNFEAVNQQLEEDRKSAEELLKKLENPALQARLARLKA